MKIVIANRSERVQDRIVDTLNENFPDLDFIGRTNDGQKAKELIEKIRPEMIILDVDLETISGVDLLKSLNKDLRMAPLIIFYTRYSNTTYKNHCLNLGASHYFDKSANIEDLLELIREMNSEEVNH